MIVYQTNNQGVYVGPVKADESPLEPGVWLIPAGCIKVPPPPTAENEVAVWVDGGWATVPAKAVVADAEGDEPVIDPKMVGVEFEGVMCSATGDDQNGLAAVLLAVQFQGADFKPTRFRFANGNELVLTLENYREFAKVWIPFRQSFYAAV